MGCLLHACLNMAQEATNQRWKRHNLQFSSRDSRLEHEANAVRDMWTECYGKSRVSDYFRLGDQSRPPGGEGQRHLSWECECLEHGAGEASSCVWPAAKAVRRQWRCWRSIVSSVLRRWMIAVEGDGRKGLMDIWESIWRWLQIISSLDDKALILGSASRL